MLVRKINEKNVVIVPFPEHKALYKYLKYKKNIEPLGFTSMSEEDPRTHPMFPNITEVREAIKEYEDVVLHTKNKDLVNFLVENNYKPFCTIQKKILVDEFQSNYPNEIVEINVWSIIVDKRARDLIGEWKTKFD